MAKYWSILEVYFCTTILLPICLCDIPLNKRKCLDNQFGIIQNHKVICKSCDHDLPKCASGLGVSIPCGEIGTESHCVSCVHGKNFSTEYDSLPCKTCTSLSCHSNEEIQGTCSPDKDTSKCSGTCKKGYYPKPGYKSLDDCQPCSVCHNNNSKSVRVQKCINDGLPFEKQCEMGSLMPEVPSKKQKGPSKENDKRKRNQHEGYKFYGHPVFFGFLVIVIVLLAIILTIFIKKTFYKDKKNSVGTNTDDVPLSGIVVGNGTDTVDLPTKPGYSTTPAAIRKRKSSNSLAQRVSVNRQNSNCKSSDEKIPPEELLVNDDTFDVKESGDYRDRKLSLSNLSGRRNRSSFSRQISNPEAEKKNEKPPNNRSKTFGSFTGLLSGQNKTGGTAEEKTSLMLSPDYNANDTYPQVVALPAQTNTALPTFSRVKIGEINADIYRQLCTKLNQPDIDSNWIKLAGRMDYTNDQVKIFEQNKNPADKLLQNWGIHSNHDVASLIELLKQINREDLVQLLEESHPTTFYIGNTA